MIRICPKCGDYNADASLAFCLVDGTPLINVDPTSERWSEGTRVIEEKENALRKQKRRLKWRRILLSAMTMSIATMVVLVVAVNGLIYLRPNQEEVVPAKPLPEATTPGELTASATPDMPPGEPILTPTPQPTATPKPTASPVVKETPPRDTTATPTPTPTPTPWMEQTPTPTPTPTPKVILIQTPTLPDIPTPDKLLECSDADKSRERGNDPKQVRQYMATEYRRRAASDHRPECASRC